MMLSESNGDSRTFEHAQRYCQKTDLGYLESKILTDKLSMSSNLQNF